jgi:hypothetical protein
MPEQLLAFRRIANNFTRQVHCQQFLSRRIAQHGDQRLIDVEKSAVRVAAAHSVRQVPDQRAVVSLGVAQLFLGAIALTAQFPFAQRAANRDGQMANIFYLDALGHAGRHQFGYLFAFQRFRQVDHGDLLFLFLERFAHLAVPPAGNGISRQNHVVIVCIHLFGELFRGRDRGGSDVRLRMLQFVQALLDFRRIVVDEKQAQHGLPEQGHASF